MTLGIIRGQPAPASFVLEQNFAIAAAPPGAFVPVNGVPVPSGHTAWSLSFDTTGLPPGQVLVDVMVQYHYTGVQLGVTGLPNQGQVTNTDGSVTPITGGPFTGWIDDCGAELSTSFTNKAGQVVFEASIGCDLNRIVGAYPDTARFAVLGSPGYTHVPSVTLTLT